MLGFDRKLARRIPIRWIANALRRRLKQRLRLLNR